MKKLITVIALIMALAVMTGCMGCVAVSWNNGWNHGGRNSVRGEGAITSGEYEVGAYDSVDIRGFMRVVYSAEPSTKIRLDIQENIRQYITFSVKNGILIVDSERNIVVPGLSDTPTLYIFNPSLRAMYVSGAVTIDNSDTITGESFRLDVSGAGDVDLTLDVKRFDSDMSGAANLRLSGNAEEADVSISGAGDIDALNLQTKRARIALSGVGSASISCSDELDASVSAVGSLTYRGSPTVRQSIVGVGSIKQVQ